MDIIDILDSNDKTIIDNIELLAKDFFQKKGKKLNKGCPSCVREMILTLKNYYKMTQFRFKNKAVSYKNKKGDKTTISNSTMTDEKAIEFLKTRPDRISLFSEYPSNWKELIEGKKETEPEKEKRMAIEAEIKEVKKNNKIKEVKKNKSHVEKKTKMPSKKILLMRMSLKELRKKYPNIKATSIEGFVDKILNE